MSRTALVEAQRRIDLIVRRNMTRVCVGCSDTFVAEMERDVSCPDCAAANAERAADLILDDREVGR